MARTPPEWRTEDSEMDFDAVYHFNQIIGKFTFIAQTLVFKMLVYLVNSTRDGISIELSNNLFLTTSEFMHFFQYGYKVSRKSKEDNPKKLQHAAQVLVRDTLKKEHDIELKDVKMICFVASRSMDTCHVRNLEDYE